MDLSIKADYNMSAMLHQCSSAVAVKIKTLGLHRRLTSTIKKKIKTFKYDLSVGSKKIILYLPNKKGKIVFETKANKDGH